MSPAHSGHVVGQYSFLHKSSTNPNPQPQCQNLKSFCATFICFCMTPTGMTPRVSYSGKGGLYITVMFHRPSSSKISPQYFMVLALPYIQEHLNLINKLLCIFVHYHSFPPLIHTQIIFRKGKKVSFFFLKSNELRSGTAHLLCSLPQRCIRFVGRWRREKTWRVPSIL